MNVKVMNVTVCVMLIFLLHSNVLYANCPDSVTLSLSVSDFNYANNSYKVTLTRSCNPDCSACGKPSLWYWVTTDGVRSGPHKTFFYGADGLYTRSIQVPCAFNVDMTYEFQARMVCCEGEPGVGEYWSNIKSRTISQEFTAQSVESEVESPVNNSSHIRETSDVALLHQGKGTLTINITERLFCDLYLPFESELDTSFTPPVYPQKRTGNFLFDRLLVGTQSCWYRQWFHTSTWHQPSSFTTTHDFTTFGGSASDTNVWNIVY